MPSESVQKVLDRLSGVRERSGGGWMASCPCRDDDHSPSLGVSEGDDGRALVNCFAGRCNFEMICSSMGLSPRDLMPDSGTPLTEPRIPMQQKKETKPKEKRKLKFVKSYDYHDEDGQLLFQKVRYVDESGKKTFTQRKADGAGGYVYTLGDTPKVLYNLPAVIAAKQRGEEIWVVEGEKDADTLIDLGLVATTSPLGAGKWLDIHTAALSSARVEIIVDNDESGRSHGVLVEKKLKEAGIQAEMWICPREKDITDFINSGGDFSEIIPFESSGHESSPNETQEEFDEDVDESEIPSEKTPIEEAVDKLQELLGSEELNASQLFAKATLILASATSNGSTKDVGRLVHWNDFVEEYDDGLYNWIIPGFLEHQERVIVVAAEGVGKTMLARQVAICSAAGINPFSLQPMPPVRTLTVDLENPEKIIRRMSRGIVAKAMSMSSQRGKAGRISGELLSKPSGMDLLKPQDRALLEQTIERVQPQLIVMGPLYKAFVDPGGRTSEAIAVEVAKYLDTIRSVYGCALWLEHHAPLGTTLTTRELRPFGSAVWSRWPEFGLALQPDPTASQPYVYQIKHFRGARDQRYWPQKMMRGKVFPFIFEDFANVNEEDIGVPPPRNQRYN